MDNFRLMLWLEFGLALWMGYQAWRLDYPPTPPIADVPAAAGSSDGSRGRESADPRSRTRGAGGELPTLPEVATVEPATPKDPGSARRLVHVATDVFDVDIDLNGGKPVGAQMREYPVDKDRPDVPVTLLSKDPDNLFELQSGLRTRGETRSPTTWPCSIRRPRVIP